MLCHKTLKYLKRWFKSDGAISAYYHWSCELESRSGRGELYTTLVGKVFQCLATSRWFSPGTPVSSTNKTECHDITEILLKVALNTITIADYKQLHKSNINKTNNHLSSQTIEHKKTTTYDVRNPDPGLR